MARDLYADVLKLASSLSNAGLTEWALRIEKMCADGATATQILMGLRWVLSELLAHDNRASNSVRADVATLENAIGEVLENLNVAGHSNLKGTR